MPCWRKFLGNLDDIVSVEGIDTVCFGPTDYALSIGLNLMYNFSHPKIKTAFEAVVAYANKHGKPVLSAVNPCAVEQSNKLSEMGVKKQHFSSDLNIIGGAFKTL